MTVAVHRRAEPGRAAEVNAWLHSGVRLAESFPGFLGAGWVRPSDDTADSMIAAEHSSTPLVVPPRWEQAASTVLGLYPIQLVLAYVLVPHIAHLTPPLRVLVTTAIVIPVMLYAVLPLLTRALARWLHA